ncbi:MAG TPA: DNA polymerase IV [Acidimicrobiaceae bacterium]|nr:DNA polymerase IV [Acidimicrobiaceae bacterium]|tara:strand:+ start:7484 stop:8698 length:1215 start_codon:yes stop_codon:yes gene_type:complete
MEDLPILHVDMDAFYVEVERQSNPSLIGKPVVVGGDSQRGVVASASYEARAMGVKSAMSSVVARRLCSDAVFVKSDFPRYREVSRRVHQIFQAVTPEIEPIALDEAFLDVGGARKLFGSSEEIAWQLRSDIYEGVGLDCSVGVASSKLLAKLASVAAKPQITSRGIQPGVGVYVVDSENQKTFLEAHPVEALWGVGAVTLRKLRSLGISTVKDLAAVPEQVLVEALGASHGGHLWKLSRGVDVSRVNSERQRKSISHEETFPSDVYDRKALESEIVRLSDAVSSRARTQGTAGRTIHLKVRRPDMSFVTRSITVDEPVDTLPEIAEKATELLAQLDIGQGVRLLGVGLSRLDETGPRQLSLVQDDKRDQSWSRLSGAMDRIRERYGHSAIGPGLPINPSENNDS